jgi:hypothetical protein
MEHELLVLALGYHFDEGIDGKVKIEGSDSVAKLSAHLPLGEQNRVERAAELARKYGRILAWARRERVFGVSATVRILASRIEQLLTQQVVQASSIKFVNVNDIYVVLWQLETVVDQIEAMLASEPFQSRAFVHQLLQDCITLDLSTNSPLTTTKYELFKDWISLQRNLLVSWLCYTKLPSHSEDFWIEACGDSENTVDSSYSEIPNGSNASNDPNAHRESSLQGKRPVNIWKAYRVVKERLPILLISESMGNQLLFIGIAMKALELAKKRGKEQELWIQRVVSLVFQRKTSSQGFCTFFGHWDAMEATSNFNELEKWATTTLFSLIMVEHQFQSHLLVLRDFFFLQDGFFYRTLFSLASNLMELTPGLNAENDINVFFQEAAAAKQFLGEDMKSKLFLNFRLTFTPSYYATQSNKAISKIWSNLCLDYTIKWPLNLILSPTVLQQYNDIFQFLLQVKKIQIGLQNSWKLLKTQFLPLRASHRFQMLRNQMGFFIDTLSQYLHVDVFTTQFQTLDERVENCKGFEDLRTAHEHFLSETLLQCFLSVPAFRRTFSSLFDIISGFTTLVRDFVAAHQPKHDDIARSVGTSTVSGASKSQDTAIRRESSSSHLRAALASIESQNAKTLDYFIIELESSMKEWSKHNNLLFVLLSGVKGQAPHLHHLLLLLDYSLFFSSGKSLLELESDRQIDWSEQKTPRRAHLKIQENSDQTPPPIAQASSFTKATSSSSSSVASSSSQTNESQPKSMKIPKAAKSTASSRARSNSAEAPPVASPPKSKATGGPRPELLARLMKKTNK